MKKNGTYRTRDEQLDEIQSENLLMLGFWKRLFARYAIRVFSDGMRTLDKRAFDLFEGNQKSVVLDLGTGDAKLLKDFNRKIGSKHLYGLDLSEIKDDKVDYIKANLEEDFPVKDNFADVLISSQNIEHVIDTPHYCSEIARVLKHGGYAIILTENLASWANIGCLLFGYIPFSLTNMFGVSYGNPFVWHEGTHNKENIKKVYKQKQWGILGHQRIFTQRGLKELLEKSGLTVERQFGGGYAGLLDWAEKFFSYIDRTHAHFIGVKVRKS